MKRGYKPFVVIRHENEASKSLYKKLGFEKAFEMARIVFTPSDQVKTDESSGGHSPNGKEHPNSKEHQNGKDEQNGNHVNGKTGYNGVNNNHEV